MENGEEKERRAVIHELRELTGSAPLGTNLRAKSKRVAHGLLGLLGLERCLLAG